MKNGILGLDIGSRNLKMAVVEANRKITHTAIVPLPFGLINNGDISDMTKLAQILKDIMNNNQIQVKEVALSLNSHKVVTREFTLPKLKEKELYEALLIELSKTFADIYRTHKITYKIYDKTKDSTSGIVTFCPKEMVEVYQELFNSIGLQFKYLDVHANTVAKTYSSFMKNDKKKELVMIVDIGCTSSQVNVLDNGKLKFSRNIACGGLNIDKFVSKQLGIDIEKAEKDKFNKYIGYELQGHDIKLFTTSGYNSIIQEIMQTFNYYTQQNNQVRFDKIYLCGGGSNLEDISIYISQIMGMEVSLIKPTDNNSAYIQEFSSLLPAIGAAIREDGK